MSEGSKGSAAGNLSVDVSETGPAASEWLAALEQLGCDQPTQTPGYFAALRAELAGTDSRPFVCTVRSGDRIRGLAIVVQGPVSVRFKLGERTLLSIPVPGLRLVDPQPVLADDQAAERLFDALAGLSHQMVVIERYNPVDGPWRRLVDGGHSPEGYSPYIAFGLTSTCAVLPAGSWDDHLKALGRKVRHELQRKDERIKREYGASEVVLHRVDGPERIGWFRDAVQAVTNDSWQGRRKATQRSVADSHEYLEALARQGLLLGYVLTACGEPIAFAFGVRHGAHCHLKEMAYNQRLKSLSPGQVLVYRVLRDLFEQQSIRLCSLGYGNARYKREICNVTAPVAMLWLPRKGTLARLAVALHRAWFSAQAAAGAMLERLSVKQEVLTWLRSG